MKLLALLTTAPLLLISSSALAASQPDLGVTIAAPSVQVDATGRYTVTVRNTGNRNAAGVTLTIQLPRTATSPTVHVMGTLGARDSRCARTGTALTCTLGTIARNGGSTAVWFDIALPYSTAALAFSATATTITLPETNPFNNTANHTATPLLYPTTVAGPIDAEHRSCTGTGLSSFFECELYPSSIQGFHAVLEADTSITLIDAPPGYTGTWTFTGPDQLRLEYFYNGLPEALIETRSVGGGCFEGPMQSGVWTVMYEVCLH